MREPNSLTDSAALPRTWLANSATFAPVEVSPGDGVAESLAALVRASSQACCSGSSSAHSSIAGRNRLSAGGVTAEPASNQARLRSNAQAAITRSRASGHPAPRPGSESRCAVAVRLR